MNPKSLTFLFLFLSTITVTISYGQEPAKDWHLLDLKKDKIPGISLEKAYKLLDKKGKKSTTVIVAVLDSGLDIEHEDILPVLWKNKKEIEGNAKDDDGNGYADDIYGWNFIGGSDGKSLEVETLELTRLYKKYKKQFDGKNKFTISASERSDYDYFLNLKVAYEEGRKKLQKSIKSNQEEYEFFHKLIPPLQKAVEKNSFSASDLRKAKIKDRDVQNLRDKFFTIIERNKDKNLTSEKLVEHYEGLSKRMTDMNSRLQYNYNLEFDGRSIVGDNYEDLKEKNYGNNDVTKRSEHGTHVSGIIGAIRSNDIGVKGIADNILIMPVRNTPMGDEADKDVANGIRYAVDNGAKIINMSFGKDYSPHKEVVDAAVRYAQEKGVLLVHGAGNDGKNTDYFYSYPSALLSDGKVATNWLEVGATSLHLDEKLAATFSNYGKQSVDIFAPGVDIYSTLPGNKYGTRSGTSMAAPVVSGVAALLMSYFPELNPEQVIEIILESGTTHSMDVVIPGSEEKTPFGSLSKSGKVINAHAAVKLALEKYHNR